MHAWVPAASPAHALAAQDFSPDMRQLKTILVHVVKPENLLEFVINDKTTLGDILKHVQQHHESDPRAIENRTCVS